MRKLALSTTLLIFTFFLVGALYGQEAAQPGEAESTKAKEKVLLDFADLADAQVSKGQIELGKWKIKLSGLSDNPKSRRLSRLRLVDADFAKAKLYEDDFSKSTETFANPKVMGIRINFAKGYNNDWAQVKTRYPLSFFSMDDGKGILKNVGPLRAVSVWVRGLNYKHSIEIRMVDADNRAKNINFGSLYFRDWRKVRWDNPDYIAEIGKRDIIKRHLYPQPQPFLMIDSIMFYKSAAEAGGDFITYIKDIRLEYEPYFELIREDIVHEKEWGIYKATEDELKAKENRKKYYDLSGSNVEEEFLGK